MPEDWDVVWQAPSERLFVEAKQELGWVRHRTRSNAPGDGSVVVLHDSGRVLFVSAVRPAVDQTLLELPRGQADLQDLDPIATAQRELLEETGLGLHNPVLAGQIFPESGLVGDAVNVVSGWRRKPDHTEQKIFAGGVEYSTHFWLDTEQIRRQIVAGQIRDGITIAALALVWALSFEKSDGE